MNLNYHLTIDQFDHEETNVIRTISNVGLGTSRELTDQAIRLENLPTLNSVHISDIEEEKLSRTLSKIITKMPNLSLDPSKVETDLAEKYLRKYNNFETWPSTGHFWHVRKYPDEKDEYAINEDESACEDMINTPSAIITRKIAKKIVEHEPMFSQLEYSIRKTEREDVKNSINLISQHIQCCRISWNLVFHLKINILMNEKTPLYALGCVAIANSLNNIKVKIVTTQKMAPICYLFTEICSQFGWQIPLVFVNDTEEYLASVSGGDNVENHNILRHLKTLNVVCKDGAFSCTGVVTESADIDSAVDIFMNSSVTAPWKLQRLYIQESVYDEVKGAFASKCILERVDSCSDAFATKGKIFLWETLSVESESGDRTRVPVEVYRTIKELCALLKQNPTPCLSLWAADSQVAHEVALEAPASLAWLNDYARFDGPPMASLPVYNIIYPRVSYPVNENCLKTLSNVSRAWKTLSRNERIDLILNTMEDIIDSDQEKADCCRNKQISILNWQNNSFVSVDNGKIWLSVEVPPHVDDINFGDVSDDDGVFDKLIIAAINGSTLVYLDNFIDPINKKIVESLEKAGVPVTKCNVNEPTQNIKLNLINNKLKMIRTNFGTIFAN